MGDKATIGQRREKLEAERLHEMMKLTKNQAKQIRALKRMKDEDIDFTDIPEKLNWSNAVVGKFYRRSSPEKDVP